MGRFDGYLLCSDFDGTLRRHDMTISPANIDALRRFTAEGGLFTIATGRSYPFIKPFCSLLPINAPVLAVNGSVLVDGKTDKVIWSMQLPSSVRPFLAQTVGEYPCIEKVDLYPVMGCHSHWGRATCPPFEEFLTSFAGPIANATLIQKACHTPILRDALRERFGDVLRFEPSWPEGIEVLPRDGGKGNAVCKLKELTGSRVSVGVGDYENDLSLMTDCDIGIAVENALPCVKEAASFVTVSCEDDALAHIIDQYLV